MPGKILTLFIAAILAIPAVMGQDKDRVSVSGLFSRDQNGSRKGELNIYQDARIDTLVSRHILHNMKLNGLDGFRIQIYNSSDKNARVESGKVEADFINRFPGIKSYATFERPGYYRIRVGNYRSRTEGTKDLLTIRRIFPDAYLVPDRINFPDLN